MSCKKGYVKIILSVIKNVVLLQTQIEGGMTK